jgi:tetratricopeptide (TPR) repeat protein
MWRVLCLLLMLASAGWRDAVAATPRAGIESALALPEALRLALPAEVQDRGIDDAVRVQRLVDFMIADDGLALRYQEQPTFGIAESFARRRVNCLSFTMMFIAIARAAGLNAYAQASDDALAMRVLDDTLYRATHVNAGIQAAGAGYTVDVGWQAILAGRKPRPITDARLVAMLHNNHAVERLLDGDHAGAAIAIAAALALDASSATLWSNAGVVHWRAGQPDAAERAYARALTLQREHVGALSNMVALHRSRGMQRQAASYERRLQRVQASDPFSQFLIAQSLAAAGAQREAIVHYRRAIRLLPDEPRFHRSLAEVYRQLGEPAAAARAGERASQLEAGQASRRGIRDAPAADPG